MAVARVTKIIGSSSKGWQEAVDEAMKRANRTLRGVTAPISGRLVHGRDPKHSFVLVQGLQGLGFLFMALARTLPEMFFARALLGLMGAVSTFAFIMAGRSRTDVRREVAAIQSSMTL